MVNLDQSFTANQLILNITETKVIKFAPMTIAHVSLVISYNGQVLDEVNNTKFLGIHMDSNMNWKIHIEQITHKLNVACFMIRNLTHTFNVDILRVVYFVYFQPILQYGIILGGNSTHAQQIFKLQKRVIRIMSGMAPRESYSNLYKNSIFYPFRVNICCL